nr:iron ABC transporter permease [Paenibacillus sp. YPD9-1]
MRTAGVILVLLVLTMALFLLSIGLGNQFTSPAEVWRTFLGNGTPQNELILGTLRLPRIIIAVCVGAAMGVSGSILQGVIRNPLASPDVIGISGGAALAAVAFITYLTGILSIQWLPLAAFAGAALVSLVIYVLAWNKGVTPVRLVLIGIGISAATSSLTMLMLILSPIKAAGQAYVWLTGSIYGTNWGQVYTLLPWVGILIPLALLYAYLINIQELGDELATALGAGAAAPRAAAWN